MAYSFVGSVPLALLHQAAGCGPLDLAACVDGAEYSLYAGVAGFAWMVDRTLLQLAYQLDQLRWWLVELAFAGAYQHLAQLVRPLYVPAAALALTIACLLFMLVPLAGRPLFSIRQVLIWITLTPVLVSVGGQFIARSEQLRSDIGGVLFAQAAGAAPGAIFGVSASDMAEPQPLYPANPCGTGQLQRPGDAGQLHMDDLAAALLYATAGDIHCPDAQGPGATLPDRFYDAEPGYATAQYVGEMLTSNDRRAAVEGMQAGMVRLLVGVLPCVLAVCEMLVHLVFALSLAVVWLALPLGLLFISFARSSAGVAALVRRVLGVLQVSWTSSLVMGLLFAALLAAARLGNAAAYTGFSIAGVLLVGYLALTAFGTLRDSLQVAGAVAESATGLALRPVSAVLSVATGGALAGTAVGLMAARQTGSAPYAAGAGAGRVPGLMAVGEVAAGMGWIDPEDRVYQGLRAGHLSRYDWRWSRTTIERDGDAIAEQRGSWRERVTGFAVSDGRSVPPGTPPAGPRVPPPAPPPPPAPQPTATGPTGAPGGPNPGAFSAPMAMPFGAWAPPPPAVIIVDLSARTPPGEPGSLPASQLLPAPSAEPRSTDAPQGTTDTFGDEKRVPATDIQPMLDAPHLLEEGSAGDRSRPGESSAADALHDAASALHEAARALPMNRESPGPHSGDAPRSRAADEQEDDE
jgi:hypothetical protein